MSNCFWHKFETLAAQAGRCILPRDRDISRPSSIQPFGPVFPLTASLSRFLDSQLNRMKSSQMICARAADAPHQMRTISKEAAEEDLN